MKIIHALAGGALLIFLLLFGVLGINWSFIGIGLLDSLTDATMGDPISVLRISVVVLTLTLVYLLSSGKGGQRDSNLQFKTENGSVQVSLNAASNYLSRLKKEFAAVVSLTPKLSVKGNGLCVVMKTGIKSGTRIPELSNLMQQRARQCITDDLGLDNIVDIRIIVTEISGPPPSRSEDVPVIDLNEDAEED